MISIKKGLIIVLCFFITNVFSQTFNWNTYPSNAASWVSSATFSVTKATSGGGSFDVRSSSAGGTSTLSSTTGDVAQNCGTYAGLRLEMSGAGNSAGTAVWNNSITVTLNFPTTLCAPVTFNIYDVTETFYTGGPNYVYYQDKVIISALDNASNPVTPGATSVGGIDNTVVGNTRVLIANGTSAQCMNQAISVGTAGQQIKQITIVYCNQDPPTHCPAPVGSPPRYGISQYQYIFISPITGALAPTASITSPTLTCGVTSTTLTATTSASSPTYSWTGPGGSTVSSPSASATAVSGAGTYTVVINPGGCSNTATYNIGSGGTPPSVTASASNTLTCTNTIVQAIASTTSTPVTYNWYGPGVTGGATTATATVNAPGTYNYTVTNTSTGCNVTGTIAVTQNTSVITASSSATSSLNCTTTSAQIIATTTASPVNYNWSGTGITGGAGTATITVNQGGTFNYTITNTSNGCKTTGSQAVTQNTVLPSPTASASGSITCSTTTVGLNGGPAALTYTWSGPGFSGGTNSQNSIATAAGSYTLAVTGANGCTNTAATIVGTNTTAPAATASLATAITCISSSAILQGGPLSGVAYSWTGAGLSGAINLANATATTTGNYTLTTTSTANGCTNTAVATVTNNLTTPTANAGATQTLACGVSTVTLTGSGTPAGSTATWLGGVASPNSFTTTVGAPGTYTLVVIHPTSGCTSTSTVAVSSSTNVPQATVNAVTNSITCTNSIVAIGVILSNTDPVSYTWIGPGISGTNNTATTSATVAGTYSVTITNTVSNCQSVFNVVVPTNTTSVSASATSGSTITCNTTTMTLASTPTGTNYAYTWSGPGTITNGTTANPIINQGGNYTVTITDNTNGCIGTGTVAVQSNTTAPTLSLTPSSLTTTCANPTATLNAISSADPSSTYVWTLPGTGSLNNTNTNNPVATGSGVFTVQVTNTVSGCISSTGTVNIIADANVPTLNATATNTLICSNQTVTLSITGADSYTWSTTETASTITVTPNQTTTYTATGTNTTTGCSNITNITVSVTPTPTIGVSASNTTICEGNSTTLTMTGGTSYTVTSPSQTTTNTIVLTPTVQTTYTITGEQQGCASTTETITIDVNTLPTIAASNATTCAGSPVTLTANGADTYTWSTTSTTNTTTVSPISNTTYTVTGTNTLTGCASIPTTVDVITNALPIVIASSNPNTTCTSGTINLTAITTATSYTWTTGNGINNTNQNQLNPSFPASTLTPGIYTYTVQVTDANGCLSPQATTTVSVIDLPNANFDLSDLSICQNENGTISINTPQSNVTYDWSINGQTITNTNPLTVPSIVTGVAGTYTVSVLASLGTCTNTAANTLTVNTLPTVALINSQVSACENTTVQLDVSAPNANYTYNWTNGSNTSTGANLTVNPLTQVTQGTYTVTVTDNNGCTNRTTGKIDLILCETFVPEFFSPNGDGVNDGFVIKNIENYPNNKLKIFNRWGNLVYQKDGYLNEFVGYANVGDAAGKEKLPAGTYYVILVYGDDKTETYNGYLLLQY